MALNNRVRNRNNNRRNSPRNMLQNRQRRNQRNYAGQRFNNNNYNDGLNENNVDNSYVNSGIGNEFDDEQESFNQQSGSNDFYDSGDASDGKVKVSFKKKLVVIKVSIIVGLILLIFLFIAVLLVAIFGADITDEINPEEIKCETVTVHMCRTKYEDGEERSADSGICIGNRGLSVSEYKYKFTGNRYVPFEDYVYGVLEGEAGLVNEEVSKAFAVAIRTYALENLNDHCEIESSSFRQNYVDNPTGDYSSIREATEGRILRDKDGNPLKGVMYDLFACREKKVIDNETYYIINQPVSKHLAIPESFLDNNSVGYKLSDYYKECSEKFPHNNNHGQGMSYVGALYLALEKNYTYEEILLEFFGDAAESDNSSELNNSSELDNSSNLDNLSEFDGNS